MTGGPGETPTQKQHRLDCFNIIVETTRILPTLTANLTPGDAAGAFKAIRDYCDSDTPSSRTDALQQLTNANMRVLKLNVSEFASEVWFLHEQFVRKGGVSGRKPTSLSFS